MKFNMKTCTLMATAAFMALSLGACSGEKTAQTGVAEASNLNEDQVYTGILPAADCDGIRYTLRLDYDDDHNFTDGDYNLVETYLGTDSVSSTGYKDLKSFKSEGDFKVENKDGKKYLRLVQDVKDSSAGSNVGPLYFLVDNDSTITLVNDKLEVSQEAGVNYSLKIVK
ncbi:MAG: copper resistance protein NlpE N-terminal domain-containing protein [Muribaculaceae bacterium]|nr:copper resistance protein NlpE N-terminal domain-containing protein [Muribaculaceae bacterium]